jgi:hypothetical protein
MDPSSNQNQGAPKKPNRGGRGQKNIVETTEEEKITTTTIIPTTTDIQPNIQCTLNNNNQITIIHISNNKFFTEQKCTSAQNIGT